MLKLHFAAYRCLTAIILLILKQKAMPFALGVTFCQRLPQDNSLVQLGTIFGPIMTSFSIRRAVSSDCPVLFDWRNDPETRRNSVSTAPVAFEDHRSWFEHSLTNEDRLLLIIEGEAIKLGMVRYDRQPNSALTSINLAPEARGRRVAAAALIESEIFLDIWPIKYLEAWIFDHNEASKRAFRAAGYIQKHEDAAVHGDPLRFIKATTRGDNMFGRL